MEEENDRLRKESLFLQLLSSDLQYSVLFQKFPASVGVGISGACELPLAWRAHKPLPWALRSSAALALGSYSDFHNTTLFSGKPLVAVTATRFACKSRAASSLPLYS